MWSIDDLLRATDFELIDFDTSYTTEEVAKMLGCSVRSIERDRENEFGIPYISKPSIRYPARLFWRWVLQELKGVNMTGYIINDEAA